MRKLFKLIKRRRLEWCDDARQARIAELSGDTEPEDDEAMAEEERLECEEDEKEKNDGGERGREEGVEKNDEENKDNQEGKKGEEGEEEEGDDDPIIDETSGAASIHMQSKRDHLANLRDQIETLKRRLGE